MIRRTLLLFALLTCVCLAASQPQRILLITIDTLRADHLGIYGYARHTSPNIDALGRKSVVFTQAYTPAPLTLPAHTSILTGLYPAHHGFRDNAFFQTAPATTVAEILKEKGFATAAFVSGAPLSSVFGLNKGFDLYDDNFPGEERNAAETTDRAARWIQKQNGPFFAWVHYFDPHAEYNPPAAFRNFSNPYDGEIAFVDSRIPQLLQAAGEEAVVILTADHGESLGEHGERTHGIFLYNATLRVPLMARFPGVTAAIRNNPVTLCDIASTILSIAGISGLHADGVSLLSPGSDRTLVAESQYAARNFGYAPLFASIHDHKKFILSPAPEFYDLATDPAELKNIVKQGKTELWIRAIRNYAAGSKSSPEADLPEEQAEKLRSLGYVSASVPSRNINPKDHIADIERLNDAMGLLHRSLFKEAETGFRKMIEKNSKDALAFRFLGDSLAAQNNYSEAEAAYKASLSIRIDAEASVRLAKSQFKSGKQDQAEKTLLATLHDFPSYHPARFELASLYAAEKRADEALALLQEDASPEAHNQKGILFLSIAQPSKAESEFRAALSVQAKPEYWNNLALSLQRLDRATEAEEAYGQSLDLNPDYTEAEVNLAFLLMQQQKWDATLSHLEHVTEAHSEMFNARLARAYALENLGRKQEALQQYQSLLRDIPGDWPQRSQLETRIHNLQH